MIAVLGPLLTTARKAGAAGLVAGLTPLSVLLVSDDPLTVRTIVATVVAGVIAAAAAGGTTYAVANRPADAPGQHAGEL